jgi:hypothetical protein
VWSKTISVLANPGRNIRRTSIAAVALLTLIAGLPLLGRDQKPVAPNVDADLPSGPMQAKATNSCLECHEARIILQQRLNDQVGRTGRSRRSRRADRLSQRQLQS